MPDASRKEIRLSARTHDLLGRQVEARTTNGPVVGKVVEVLSRLEAQDIFGMMLEKTDRKGKVLTPRLPAGRYVIVHHPAGNSIPIRVARVTRL